MTMQNQLPEVYFDPKGRLKTVSRWIENSLVQFCILFCVPQYVPLCAHRVSANQFLSQSMKAGLNRK